MQWNGVRERRQAGVAPRVCGRVGNGRGMEARQGAIRVFGGIPIPPFSPWLCADGPAASAPEPGPTKPDARSCEAWARERPGAFAQGLARGDGLRDRASGEAGMVSRGALRRERCLRKNADGPLPRFHPAAVPDISRKAPCAPQRRRVWTRAPRVVTSPWVDPRFATKSTKTLIQFVDNFFRSCLVRVTPATRPKF